jgi:quercetin dioxygenase-like cupin family protein
MTTRRARSLRLTWAGCPGGSRHTRRQRPGHGNHVSQVDPATVPTGFLAAHNSVSHVPVSVIARAVERGRADVFIQHVRLDADAPTSWHTHPGPAIVTVVSGALTHEDANKGRCRHATYRAGQGFVDWGFGHVHRAVAGPAGADFYVTYIFPPTHLIPASPPHACA